MPEELNPKEQEILDALFSTYKKNANLYLDLAKAFSDWHPDEVGKWVSNLQEKKLLHYLETEEGAHLLCRITDHGVEVLDESTSFFDKLGRHKKTIAYTAGIVLIVLIIGFSASGLSPESFMGSITGTGITPKTETILNEWIENQEQEVSDNYTFSLLDTEGSRRTYLVECKIENLKECKYNIVFVELDEKTDRITNVELPWEE